MLTTDCTEQSRMRLGGNNRMTGRLTGGLARRSGLCVTTLRAGNARSRQVTTDGHSRDGAVRQGAGQEG
jgi:hypothetical protein